MVADGRVDPDVTEGCLDFVGSLSLVVGHLLRSQRVQIVANAVSTPKHSVRLDLIFDKVKHAVESSFVEVTFVITPLASSVIWRRAHAAVDSAAGWPSAFIFGPDRV